MEDDSPVKDTGIPGRWMTVIGFLQGALGFIMIGVPPDELEEIPTWLRLIIGAIFFGLSTFTGKTNSGTGTRGLRPTKQ